MCMIPLCSVGMFMSFSETEDARKTSKSKIIRVYALDDTNGTGTPYYFYAGFTYCSIVSFQGSVLSTIFCLLSYFLKCVVMTLHCLSFFVCGL